MGEIPVMALTLVLGDLPIAKEFTDHADPVVRFIANVYLLKSGNWMQLNGLNKLIDDDSLDEFDARYLKTRFSAMVSMSRRQLRPKLQALFYAFSRVSGHQYRHRGTKRTIL